MRKTLEKVMLIPYTFVLMNWAPVAGLYYFVRGRPMGIWNPVAVKHT
jgi:hypothetical protein